MACYIQVATTVSSEDEAKRLARQLIERRLAGCVQVSGPISSTYRWQGEIEESQEWVCSAKTRADRFAELSQTISELHSYDVPEIIATPIVDVSSAYQAWLDKQIG